ALVLGRGGRDFALEPLDLAAELGARLLELRDELGDACVPVEQHLAGSLELRGRFGRAALARLDPGTELLYGALALSRGLSLRGGSLLELGARLGVIGCRLLAGGLLLL